MADLTTLDPTSPPDSEAVSNGANRMREERADIIGYASVEHALSGQHKFPQGDGTFPALPGVPAPGFIGRLFLDTINNRFLRDTGAAWQMMHAASVNVGTSVVVGPIPVTTTPSIIISTTVNYPASRNIFVIATATVVNSSGFLAQFQGQIFRDATPFPAPGLQYSFNLPNTDTNQKTIWFWGLDTSGAAGNHVVGLSLATNSGTMYQLGPQAIISIGF